MRKSGNRIRVTAQLIKADDGFHLFSETYDRELEDIFAVQDEIAQKISDALLSEIIGTEAPDVAETDTEAYELYLQARQRIHTRDIFNLREANTMLDRALDIDRLPKRCAWRARMSNRRSHWMTTWPRPTPLTACYWTRKNVSTKRSKRSSTRVN